MSSALVVTISDSAAAGDREDLSGPEVRGMLESAGFSVVSVEIVPDDRDKIEAVLRFAADTRRVPLVVTTGGTGLSPRDMTPEATLAVCDRQVPGLSELMRQEGLRSTRRAALSRGVSGIRASTLIINLPGSLKGVRESLGAVLPILPHAVETLGRASANCGE